MLILGHAGISLASALVITGIASRALPEAARHAEPEGDGFPGLEAASNPPAAGLLARLGGYADLRFLLIGSILPDLIDKPVGQYFFVDTFSNGRIFCHTALFVVLISLLGLLMLRRWRTTSGLLISFGVLLHLAQDGMWAAPRTLMWPFLGLAFEPMDLGDWTMNLLRALVSDPAVYVPEMIGAAVLAWFVWALARAGSLRSFLLSGRIG